METVKVPDSSNEYRLTKLVDQYQVSLLQMCFMYLHDRTLAEDAVQETFLKVYKSMAAFRAEHFIFHSFCLDPLCDTLSAGWPRASGVTGGDLHAA